MNKRMLYKGFINHYSKNIRPIIKEIKKAKNIAVIGHIEPDGDSIGSQLALYKALSAGNWNVDLINEGPFESKYVGGYKRLFKKTIAKEYDLYLIVDTPSIDRLGKILKRIDFNKSIVIDHHVTNEGYCKINWIDDYFISTSEMIYILLDKMKIGLDNEEVCQILLNGIISDNGYFKHIRRDKSFSLLISYFLTQKGADPKESYNRIFGQKSIFSKRLLSLALSRLQTIGSGKILWTYITDDDKKSNNNSTADSAAVFNEIMSVNNAEIGIYFKISKDKVNISFRSNDSIDVAELAKSFGGGGHRVASGTTIAGKFEDIRDNVLNRALELVKRVK